MKLRKRKPQVLTLEYKVRVAPISTNQGNRMHWAARRRALLPYKHGAFDAVIKAGEREIERLGQGKLEVLVHLPFRVNRRRDPHNYVGTNVKAVVDGLVMAGLLIDDSAEYVTVKEPVLVVQESAAKEGYRVVVYIKEAEE